MASKNAVDYFMVNVFPPDNYPKISFDSFLIRRGIDCVLEIPSVNCIINRIIHFYYIKSSAFAMST